jgi:flagellar protein FliS
MAPSVRETYLAGEVFSATPQKLQLMLIEAAIRLANQASEHWQAGRQAKGTQALGRCQMIMVELLSGLRPDQMPELVARVAGVYMFVYRSLVAAQRDRDPRKVADAVQVLEIERETWRQVCVVLGQASEPPPQHERLALEA